MHRALVRRSLVVVAASMPPWHRSPVAVPLYTARAAVSSGTNDRKTVGSSSSNNNNLNSNSPIDKKDTPSTSATPVSADHVLGISNVPKGKKNAFRKRIPEVNPSETAAKKKGASELVIVDDDDEEELRRLYTKFSGTIGGCSVEELLKGVEQTYYSTAVLIDQFVQGMKTNIPIKDEQLKMASAADDAAKLIDEEFLPEKEWSTALLTPEMQEALNTENPSDIRQMARVVSGITSVVPMSARLAEAIFTAWVGQRERVSNVYSFAAPSDYILNTKIAMFITRDIPSDKCKSQNTKLNLNVTVPPASGNGAVKATTVVEPKDSNSSDDDAKVSMNKEGEEPAAAAGAASASETEDSNNQGYVISVNGQSLSTIPPSAEACIVVTMDVIVPPERYAANYEWYYNRIIGYDSEFERIAAARVFAQNSPRWLGRTMDMIMRMFTNKPVEFMFSKPVGKMLGIPENIAECPPATRKLACLYMDQTKRWVLSDLVPISPVMSSTIPKA